ncbi:hypothetical protein [Sporomusa acidovorans]|uniref:Uncharacterized protein n=1 Tax=Sporomusa acidovorans (strain ATCC 49682 / DSM 3132 / Mol) TaxID=1123286 RepID=A0ABZ3J7X6_SPOA4|nr:hypothetical protein [Sporomusa acidovorans]OZC19284.1 hypothetical protein SPACI_28740 [Sporomusa acidovorans DSM 3132]SDD81940.1 hypothetical protein SAMN04488499_1004144 [Sporomusa acidovorans]
MLTLGITTLLLGIWPGTGLAAADTVDSIEVTVSAVEPPPARIARRMNTSIMTVGEQMLVGRTISDVETNQAKYENLIGDIFNRVLVGYTVEQVHLTPGASTGILVVVKPWGDVVRDVSLEVDCGSLSPEVLKLIKNDMGKLEDQVANVLIGLPVDSVEWAGGISKNVIRELLAAELPEFRSNLEITAGQQTIVKLSLSPAGPIINNVQLSLRSRTIPNILLADARPAIAEAANMLRGLPVAFVERHKDYFMDKLQTTAAKHPLVKRYGITLTPVINPGTDTDITLNAETTKYRLMLEGNLDMGRQEDNTSAKLHVGKFTGKQDEAFLEIKFIPNNLDWEFEPGWGHKFNNNTTGGLRYNISERESILWVNHYFGTNWMLRLEDTPKNDYYEFGLRYKMHDFLSAEYIVTEKENWLRLVANL